MKVLALVPDAFGGHGGIAKYNRDLLRALCAYPTCSEVVAHPRQMPMRDAAEPLPATLTYVTSDLGGKLRYLVSVSKVVHRNSRFDLILCGHINLLHVAFAVRFWARAPVALFIHGLEAWRLPRRPLTTFLYSNVGAFISVSQLTKRRFLGWAGPKGKGGSCCHARSTLNGFALDPRTQPYSTGTVWPATRL
jgi:phosphatidyl-myo-inositol dimannoside synthase